MKPNESSILEFVQEALKDPIPPPPKTPKRTTLASQSPPRRLRPRKHGNIWHCMTKAQRRAYAKHLASKRSPENMARGHKVPHGGWTVQSAEAARARARIEAQRLVNVLCAEGTLDLQDTESVEATLEALTFIRSPGGKTRREKAARKLLRQYHPEVAGSFVL